MSEERIIIDGKKFTKSEFDDIIFERMEKMGLVQKTNDGKYYDTKREIK